MKKDVKVIFEWANSIGDSNINNRILAKVIPLLIQEKIILTDSIIQNNQNVEVPLNVYEQIKMCAENLLDTKFKEDK